MNAMDGLYDSIRITSVASTILESLGIKNPDMAQSNVILNTLINKKTNGRGADRVFMFNPDAVALWLYQKYTALFTNAVLCSDAALPMLSVMPSVTPVCFASMYTGVMPEVHGITAYKKPVLKQNTVFDELIKCGKKCAIVSTEGDSISKIFLERNMDYYIYETEEEVNEKAIELIKEDKYDLIVVYNGNYDSTMHHTGPESKESIDVLKENIKTYSDFVSLIKNEWKDHDVFYAFAPDHGCHEIDGDSGAHGLCMEEDMNIIHFYGVKPKNE